MNKKDIVGLSYRLSNGKAFKIIDVETYPVSKVSPKYKEILDFNKGEQLIAIGYRGTLIPNITADKEGVFRITVVEMDGKIYNRPSKISKALGIKSDMTSYSIKRA